MPPKPLEHMEGSAAFAYAPMAATTLGETYARWVTAFEAHHVQLHGITYPTAQHFEGRANGPTWVIGPKPQKQARRGITWNSSWAQWWVSMVVLMTDVVKIVRSPCSWGLCGNWRLSGWLWRHRVLECPSVGHALRTLPPDPSGVCIAKLLWATPPSTYCDCAPRLSATH